MSKVVIAMGRVSLLLLAGVGAAWYLRGVEVSVAIVIRYIGLLLLLAAMLWFNRIRRNGRLVSLIPCLAFGVILVTDSMIHLDIGDVISAFGFLFFAAQAIWKPGHRKSSPDSRNL